MSSGRTRKGVFQVRTLKKLASSAIAVASAALILSACSSSTPNNAAKTGNNNTSANAAFDPTNFHPSWLTSNINATGSPVRGGTLKIEGSIDLSQALDTAGEYETIGYDLERVFARQLVSYQTSANFAQSNVVTPDAATSLGNVSADGLTYTFHLRSGLMWNTNPPRPVTSQDFVLGMKRICDPTLAPNGNPGYYISTIKGFGDFCTPFMNMDPTSTAAARAAYINGHQISGISTPDSTTIIFTLTQPASDFLYIMALPFTAAAPVEYLKYVPLTPGNPLFSDGPYQVSNYNVGHEVDFTRNPEWKQSTDPIRHDYVDGINVKLDLAGASAASQVQQDMEAGTNDLSFNTIVPTEEIPSLESPKWNPNFGAFPTPGASNPYLVFNVQSPNNGGALGNVKVRQALEYAIDKIAMNKIYGGPSINLPVDQVIPLGAQGSVAFNDYPTPNHQGDPAKCKALLKAAGVTNLTLKDYYRNNGNHPAVFQEVQSDFAKCGVNVVGTPIVSGYYGSKGIGVKTADGLKAGNWDITEPGWIPDWFGPGNGRAVLPDIVDGALNFPGTDWGGYDNPAVDKLVTQALAAKTQSAASALWHQADVKAMADAPIIPFQTQLTAIYHSSRVHGAYFLPFSQEYDITQMWLK